MLEITQHCPVTAKLIDEMGDNSQGRERGSCRYSGRNAPSVSCIPSPHRVSAKVRCSCASYDHQCDRPRTRALPSPAVWIQIIYFLEPDVLRGYT
jgi:hypothetical protein